mmetsp:Transcript_22791/g.52750  ORF Transcript_22791/g.52750 Transcript_22791/m.52750 type:complete len:236 (-) Transcript_22791:154-861(-)
MTLKELVEAALHRPRPTQRLLLEQTVLEEDFRSLAGLLPEGATEAEITLLKQDTAPSSLFDEARAGRGGTCLALLQLPEKVKLMNYVDPELQQSCLYMAARMRLGAACLTILECQEFEHINLTTKGPRSYTALHAAVASNMPDVCAAILKRKDFTQGRQRVHGESALDTAVAKGHRDCVFAMVPLLSTRDLLDVEVQLPPWRPRSDLINMIARGDRDIAKAIQDELATRDEAEAR